MSLPFALAMGLLAAVASPSDGGPRLSEALPAGHPPVKGGAAPSAEALLQQLDAQPDLQTREKTFEIAAAMGKLYYSGARYKEAALFFAQAEEKAEPLRVFYLAQAKKAGVKKGWPPPEKIGCAANGERSLQGWLELSGQKLSTGGPVQAASCAYLGLRPVLDVQEGHAKALFLTGEAEAARGVYDRILAVDETHAEALFGRAAIRLEAQGDDVKALTAAHRDLQALVTQAPGSVRVPEAKKLLSQIEAARSAGGITQLAQKRAEKRRAHPVQPATSPMPLTREMVEAVQNTERTPELEKGLSQLVEEGEGHLAHQRYQEALDAYKRVVPFQPENGRARAGMAWALVGLGKPMADRVWGVAVSGDPSSVEKLGDALREKGDARGAKALWQKLAETAPEYAQKSGLATRLK